MRKKILRNTSLEIWSPLQSDLVQTGSCSSLSEPLQGRKSNAKCNATSSIIRKTDSIQKQDLDDEFDDNGLDFANFAQAENGGMNAPVEQISRNAKHLSSFLALGTCRGTFSVSKNIGQRRTPMYVVTREDLSQRRNIVLESQTLSKQTASTQRNSSETGAFQETVASGSLQNGSVENMLLQKPSETFDFFDDDLSLSDFEQIEATAQAQRADVQTPRQTSIVENLIDANFMDDELTLSDFGQSQEMMRGQSLESRKLEESPTVEDIVDEDFLDDDLTLSDFEIPSRQQEAVQATSWKGGRSLSKPRWRYSWG